MMDPIFLVYGAYAALAGLYLLVLPILATFYIDKRWTSGSSWEKVLMFFLGLFLFPGLLLVGAFINYRPQRRF
ncbi:MAG: NAD(P)H-quinone oxidoreductase subunit L [Cyanobacteriota bacterium]|nr:NAD(P)H-quinone oxidoreductase subunit L [Cyanobacteriota bacterium]